MPAWIIDIILLGAVLAITWVVSSEGLWGAALMFVNVMFGGLIAFNFYEPLADLVDENLDFMVSFSDFVCLIVLFSVAFTLLRLATDFLGPTMVRFSGWLYQIGRLVFGAATAWYLVGMFLCIIQTAPIHKQFLGYQWQNHAFWSVGIDRFWLGYVQDSTARIFERSEPRIFDEQSDFIKRYHDHRKFGHPDPTFGG